MNFLLIDNSNTRTKFALSDGDTLDSWHQVISTADICEDSLQQCLQGASYDKVMVSSVVPQKAEVMKNYFGEKSCHFLSHLSRLPIEIEYPKPEQIGADRLANAAAAAEIYGSPAIVIDFGTAVTFDIIGDTKTGKPVYEGGVIAPGMASMTEGLARRTALLPHIELKEPEQAIGKSTEQAMLAGAVYGYRGLVREILTQIQTEIPKPATIIATGGDSTLIAKELSEIKYQSAQLTLEGLRLIANLNF